MAHPFEDKFKDTIGFINDLRKEEELDIKIGIRRGNLSISKEIIEEWLSFLH